MELSSIRLEPESLIEGLWLGMSTDAARDNAFTPPSTRGRLPASEIPRQQN